MQNFHISEKIKNWLYIGLQVIIILLAMALGYFGRNFFYPKQDDMGLVLEAKEILLENTILEIPSNEELQHGMVRGMLETLDDPHTYFVDPAAHEVFTNELTGSYGGIGVRLEQDLEMNWRLYPLPDSPGFKAGIIDGDILLSVDDTQITKQSSATEVIAAVRGPVGETVKIQIQRNAKSITFNIIRSDVPLPSVSWNIIPEAPNIGFVKVNRISESTEGEIKTAIQDLRAKNAEKFILDLRDNGGGLVDSGAAIANLFLKNGEIFRQQYRDQDVEIYKVNQSGKFSELPLVVLINNNTASSAEIVAGALNKHGRAPLIGTQSFGKTSIQYVFDLQDGSSIHITSGRWWIPGVNFPLQPDYLIIDDPSGVAVLQKAIETLNK